MGYLSHLECYRCGHCYPPEPLFSGCPACAGLGKPSNLFCVYDYQRVGRHFSVKALQDRPLSLWRYHEFLPVDPKQAISLQEGWTPLIPCPRLGRRYGVPNLYLKDESRNPTWSFKDRLACLGASRARVLKRRVLTLSSTGNAGAAVAAYAARGGLKAVVFTTQTVPLTMRALMQSYGARVLAVPKAADRWKMVALGVEKYGWFPVQNFMVPPVGANPYALEGTKTVGFELCEQLDWRPPDVVVAPVSAGDLPVGVWRGFLEFQRLGLIDRIPEMIAAEVFGPVSHALEKGLDHTEAMPTGPSVAVSTAVANSAYQCLKMVRETGGTARVASDAEIMEAQLELAEAEGIYAEPSSALPLAVIKKLAAGGELDRQAVVVSLLTSTGLKDPEPTYRYLPEIPLLEPTEAALEAAVADLGVSASRRTSHNEVGTE